MKRFIGLSLAIALILFPLLGYTYMKGCEDGVARYKHSKNLMLTLDSMYHLGWLDGFDAAKGK